MKLEDPKRNCDIVMKGGITSGVVYPKAISRLSKRFVFKNVGGTSAGAIAAAATAAAEYRRVRTGSEEGFAILEKLGDELSATPAGSANTKLYSLFLPEAATRRVFEVLMGFIGQDTLLEVMSEVLKRALRQYFAAALVGCLPGLTLALISFFASNDWVIKWMWILIGILISGVGAVVGMVVALLYEFVMRVPDNNYGLCSGTVNPAEKNRSKPEPLTIWLNGYLNNVAGIEGDKPLTFGDLWKPKGKGNQTASKGRRREECDIYQTSNREINLEMMTTNLTHGRPYRLPFRNDDDLRENHLFYFRKNDFYRLFPASIVEWMVNNPRGLSSDIRTREKQQAKREERKKIGFYPLPDPRDLPVIVATRMSLSFPVLLSIVPLYWSNNTESQEYKDLEQCWFTDGGVCSNFPLHFFDSPLPRRPTFSLDLMAVPNDTPEKELVPKMEKDNRPELMDRWNRFDLVVSSAGDYKNKGNFGKLIGFAATLISTMQNWNDATQSRLPGYRDRITRIPLTAKQGGLNLNMQPEVVNFLAGQGEAGAIRIIDRFDVPPAENEMMTWENHRWIRIRGMLAAFEKMTVETLRAYDCPEEGDLSYKEWLSTLNEDKSGEYLKLSYKATKKQIGAAIATFERLREIREIWSEAGTAAEESPRPRPILRPRPQI